MHCGPSARHIYPSLVLVQPRKTRPYITERLLMGHKESSQQTRSPCMLFYLWEFLSHCKFTPISCFIVKYRRHECNMIIGLFPLPVDCVWCSNSVFTVIWPFFFDPDCSGRPLSAPDPGWLLTPSCSVWCVVG